VQYDLNFYIPFGRRTVFRASACSLMERSATERHYLPFMCNHDPYIKEHVANVKGMRNTQRILIGKPRSRVRYVWA